MFEVRAPQASPELTILLSQPEWLVSDFFLAVRSQHMGTGSKVGGIISICPLNSVLDTRSRHYYLRKHIESS